MGRITAIAMAAIAGIASLPALLGGDRPPPLPPDVGLTPPPPSSSPAPLQPPVPPPAIGKPDRSNARLANRKKRLGRTHPRRERTHRRHREAHHRHQWPSPPAPTPAYTGPPVYSYVPPPHSGEFRIER